MQGNDRTLGIPFPSLAHHTRGSNGESGDQVFHSGGEAEVNMPTATRGHGTVIAAIAQTCTPYERSSRGSQ